MTRIISGKYKGRRIGAPKKLPVRPTTDMAKEALFNIVRSRYHMRNLKILDLFSGTGNISYEFASRGTEQITAVEGHYGCVKFIEQTSKEFDFTINALKSDVYKYLEGTTGTYDIIFADPPYDFALEKFEKIAELVFEHNLLDSEGMLIIEHSKHTKLDHLNHFQEMRHYGGNAFSFFELPNNDDHDE